MSRKAVYDKKYILDRVEIDKGWCWNWKGSLDRDGYGRVKNDTGRFLVHRKSYELFRERIPAEMVIDHLCRNRKCVNPDHLEVVTKGENSKRQQFRRVVYCKRGHEYTIENTQVLTAKDGCVHRRCKECARQAVMASYLRHRDRRIADMKSYDAKRKLKNGVGDTSHGAVTSE